MKSADDFLKSDFDQCFQQMRHYDTLFIGVVNFAFALFAAVVGASVAFLDNNPVTDVAYIVLSFLYLTVTAIGLLILAFLLRNRCYFTYVARYINEVRGRYIANLTPSFSNITDLPTNPSTPRMFSPGSTQIVLMYFIALFNTCFAVAARISFVAYRAKLLECTFSLPFVSLVVIAIVLLIVQLVWILMYLRNKDSVGAKRAWWGN